MKKSQYQSQREIIYVLSLADGNYYVGKTNDIVRRFDEHLRGEGSAWTKLHNARSIVQLEHSTSLFDEDKITLEYMNEFGIDKVRGGVYSTLILDENQQQQITAALRNANNLCHMCGKEGHFINKCPNNKKSNVTKPQPKAVPQAQHSQPGFFELVFGGVIEIMTAAAQTPPMSPPTSPSQSYELRCSRCLRSGHLIDNCYAGTDIYGNRLIKK